MSGYRYGRGGGGFSPEIEEIRRRLSKGVRRITVHRRALEYQTAERARAKAEGRRVRWDEACAELAKTDPKAAAALLRIAVRQREYTRRRAIEKPPEPTAEAARKKRARELAWHHKKVLERWRTPIRCEHCGVQWCVVPAPGRRRSRFCTERCRGLADYREKRRNTTCPPGGTHGTN